MTWSRVWRKNRFLEDSMSWRQRAGVPFFHHHRDGRAIWTEPVQVLPQSYRALADHHSNVSHSTLHHRARGRPSMKNTAQGQQYLKPYEEEVIVKYLLQMSDVGHQRTQGVKIDQVVGIGKAKVMSYEDLEEARAKRFVKEATRAAKGKGRSEAKE